MYLCCFIACLNFVDVYCLDCLFVVIGLTLIVTYNCYYSSYGIL